MHSFAATIKNLLAVLFFLFSFSTAFAGSVSQLKGTKVLIELEGDSAQPGQDFYVLDSNGKKVAIVKISQVKGNKGTGEVTKGKAILGGATILKAAGQETPPTASKQKPTAKSSQKTKTEETNNEPSTPVSSKRKKLSGGVLAGYGMNTMTLTVQNPNVPSIKEDATLTDSSFSVKAFADYDFSPSFTIRFATGWEPYSVKGTTSLAICNNGSSKSCTVSMDYLALEGSAHYNFLTGKTRGWVGLGYSFLIEMSKNVDVPNLSSSGGTNQMVLASVGADFGLSGGKFIPVVVEYGMFPGSSNVVASSIYLRAGYGFNF